MVYLRDLDSRILQQVELDGEEGAFSFLGDRRAIELGCYATGRSSSGWLPLPRLGRRDETPESSTHRWGITAR